MERQSVKESKKSQWEENEHIRLRCFFVVLTEKTEIIQPFRRKQGEEAAEYQRREEGEDAGSI